MGHHIARVHMKILPKRLRCSVCEEEHILFDDHWTHMSSKHGIEPEPTFENCFNKNHEFKHYQCDECGLMAKNKSQLESHLLKHVGNTTPLSVVRHVL